MMYFCEYGTVSNKLGLGIFKILFKLRSGGSTYRAPTSPALLYSKALVLIF